MRTLTANIMLSTSLVRCLFPHVLIWLASNIFINDKAMPDGKTFRQSIIIKCSQYCFQKCNNACTFKLHCKQWHVCSYIKFVNISAMSYFIGYRTCMERSEYNGQELFELCLCQVSNITNLFGIILRFSERRDVSGFVSGECVLSSCLW